METLVEHKSLRTRRIYAMPGQPGSIVSVKAKYENFIGGRWIKPSMGHYMDDLSPVNGRRITKVPRSTMEDVELALDAAHEDKDAWAETSLADRAMVLNRIADAIELNLEMLSVAETYESGKPVRETLNQDIPLAADHFRYFAGATRTLEGSITETDRDTVSYHFHEPVGVVAQIIPFNFPILLAAWKIAPALAAGNCTIVKPSSSTPWSILKLMELIQGIVPPGVVNVITGPGPEIGRALASNRRVAKVAFTGKTVTGKLIMQYTAENLIPSTTELGGKSPNIFFDDVMSKDDEFREKAIEGLVLYAFNKGEVSTCPSRALIQESVYHEFMDLALDKIRRIKEGNPFDTSTQVGPQVSEQQLEKVMAYVDIGKQEGAKLLIGGHRAKVAESIKDGYYFEPTVFEGDNRMRIFQEEIFGPVLSVTTFKDEADAVRIANDSAFGLGAVVWTRDSMRAYRIGRAIKAGRVWINNYHIYPAGPAFSGYRISGIGGGEPQNDA